MDLEKIIDDSGFKFLKNITFEEVTPGRFFQKEKIDLGNGLRYFYVILMPNIESPIHDHSKEKIIETHQLLFGDGKFIIYENNNKQEINLELDNFHKVFSNFENTPKHKYVAGKKGSITLAIEILKKDSIGKKH